MECSLCGTQKTLGVCSDSECSDKEIAYFCLDCYDEHLQNDHFDFTPV